MIKKIFFLGFPFINIKTVFEIHGHVHVHTVNIDTHVHVVTCRYLYM